MTQIHAEGYARQFKKLGTLDRLAFIHALRKQACGGEYEGAVAKLTLHLIERGM